MTPTIILRRGAQAPADPEAVALIYDKRLIFRGRDFAQFSPQEFAVISAIIVARGGCIRIPDLIDMLYADREDGGAERPRDVVNIRVFKSRPRLQRLGIEILCRYSFGYSAHFLPVATSSARAA